MVRSVTGDQSESAQARIDANRQPEVDFIRPLIFGWRHLLSWPIGSGLVGVAVALLLPPVYTAHARIIPPQQQQSSAAAALASLGTLTGLGTGGTKSPGEQYVALLQSDTVADHLIQQFALMTVYGSKFIEDARKTLDDNTHITLGKKDGLILIEVDDASPQRAASMASQYVAELRHLTDVLAVSEAQQRRVFFEQQMHLTLEKLKTAQVELQASGFTEGVLKTEPKTAADTYAQLRAELMAAEVRLQGMHSALADAAPEVQLQRETVSALRAQVEKSASAADKSTSGPDYVGKYREFKAQEALYDMFSRQYEAARVDESREGGLVQVVDPAKVPQKKSGPKRMLIVILFFVAGLFATGGFLICRELWRARWRSRLTASSGL